LSLQLLVTKNNKIMKKYINYITFFIALTVCKAQTPVFDILDIEDGPKDSYYKDINGVLNAYEGIYLYTNGNTSLKFILKKKEKSYSGYYYRDLVVGEFQYIKDGIELINTLENINLNYGKDERVKHRIKGSRIITGTELGCPDCSATEKRLRLSFVENKFVEDRSPFTIGIDIRKTTVNGGDAIKVNIFGGQHIINKSSYPGQTLPPLGVGEYLMIKQPYPNTTIESNPFTKIGCPLGGKPSAVIYTVEAGKYSSYVSQADANAQAQAEITANGQSNANAKGTCTFTNTAKSDSFTRKNCIAGSTAGTLFYTVAAGKYTSILSQADADAKAQDDIATNGPKRANALCSCSFNSKALIKVGFRKNNCPAPKVGSIVYYSSVAGAVSSNTSQADADALVKKAGQANANAKGTCR
jgi:hypothetical protein